MSGETNAGVETGSDPVDPSVTAQLNTESQEARGLAQQGLPPTSAAGWQNPRAVELDQRYTQSAAAAATGAGFEFTPEQIDLQLSRCSQLLNELVVDIQGAQAAQMAVHPPAPDAASVEQANAAKNLFVETTASFQAGVDFLTQWQAKLNEAKTNYMQTEQATADQWNHMSKGIDA